MSPPLPKNRSVTANCSLGVIAFLIQVSLFFKMGFNFSTTAQKWQGPTVDSSESVEPLFRSFSKQWNGPCVSLVAIQLFIHRDLCLLFFFRLRATRMVAILKLIASTISSTSSITKLTLATFTISIVLNLNSTYSSFKKSRKLYAHTFYFTNYDLFKLNFTKYLFDDATFKLLDRVKYFYQ